MKRYLLTLFIALFLLNGCSGKEKPKETPSRSDSQEVKAEPEERSVKEPDDKEREEVKESVSKNSPPRITSITVTPRLLKKGDVLKVDVNTVDPDGDEVDLIYEWTWNREPLSGITDTLILTDDFIRGDRIKLTVTPCDWKAKGAPGFMDATIGNSPPELTSSPDTLILKDREFSYQVKATDADGDPLAYHLNASPAGMIIDPDTGLIQWNVPHDFSGKTSINVFVSDGNSGEAVQNFVLEIMSGL